MVAYKKNVLHILPILLYVCVLGNPNMYGTMVTFNFKVHSSRIGGELIYFSTY